MINTNAILKWLSFKGESGEFLSEIVATCRKKEWISCDFASFIVYLLSSENFEFYKLCNGSYSDIPPEELVECREEISRTELNPEMLLDSNAFIVTANPDLRYKVFVKGETNSKELSEIGKQVLELIATCKRKGITQAELSRVLNMDSRTVFYHVKNLIKKSIVTKKPVTINGIFSQLIILNQCLKPDDESDSDYADDECLLDVEKCVTALVDVLRSAHNQSLAYLDIRNKLDGVLPMEWKSIKRTLSRLEESGVLERFYIKDDNKDIRCARLLKNPEDIKGFKSAYSTSFNEEAPKPPDAANSTVSEPIKSVLSEMECFVGPALRSDLSLDSQIFYLIASSGSEGITASEIFMQLGFPCAKALNKLLNDFTERKDSSKVRRVKEICGKEQRWRYFISTPKRWGPMFGTKSKAVVAETIEKEAEMPTSVPTAPSKVVNLDERNKNFIKFLELEKVIEHGTPVITDFQQKYEEDINTILDRKSLRRMATNLESKKLLKIIQANVLTPSGTTLKRILYLHPSVDPKGPEVEAVLQRIITRISMNVVNPGEKIYKDIEVEREHVQPVNSVSSSAKIATKFGWIKEKLSRAKPFHHYIFCLGKGSLTDSPDYYLVNSSAIFRNMPLQLYLRTVGCFNEDCSLADYIKQGGDLSLAVSKLPYPLGKNFFTSSKFPRFKRSIKILLDLLQELNLITATEEIITEEDGSKLVASYYKVFRNVSFHSYNVTKNEIEFEDGYLESPADVIAYWSRLEVATLAQRTADEDSKNIGNATENSSSIVSEFNDAELKARGINPLTPNSLELPTPVASPQTKTKKLLSPQNFASASFFTLEQIESIKSEISRCSSFLPEAELAKSIAENLNFPEDKVEGFLRGLTKSFTYKSKYNRPKQLVSIKKKRVLSLRLRTEDSSTPSSPISVRRIKRAKEWDEESDSRLVASFFCLKYFISRWPKNWGTPWNLVVPFFPDQSTLLLRRRKDTVLKRTHVRPIWERRYEKWPVYREKLVQDQILKPEPVDSSELKVVNLDLEIKMFLDIPLEDIELQDQANVDQVYFESIDEWWAEGSKLIDEPLFPELIDNRETSVGKFQKLCDLDYIQPICERKTSEAEENDSLYGLLKSVYFNMVQLNPLWVNQMLLNFKESLVDETIEKLKDQTFIHDSKSAAIRLGTECNPYVVTKSVRDILDDLSKNLFSRRRDMLKDYTAGKLLVTNLWPDTEFLFLIAIVISGISSYVHVNEKMNISMKAARNNEPAPLGEIIFTRKHSSTKRRLAEELEEPVEGVLTQKAKFGSLQYSKKQSENVIEYVGYVKSDDIKELLDKNMFSTELVRNEIIGGKLVRTGYNDARFILRSDSYLSDKVQLKPMNFSVKMNPRLWLNVDGSLFLDVYCSAVLAVLYSIVNEPGICLHRLLSKFKKIFGFLEVVELVEFLEWRKMIKAEYTENDVHFVPLYDYPILAAFDFSNFDIKSVPPIVEIHKLY